MRRSARRRRDFAVPSGMPEGLGDLAVGLPPKYARCDRATLLGGQQIERGAHPLRGEQRGRHLLHVGRR